ncbi:MAG: hypothetical protein IPL91_02785 [Hyphomicrobium sp.]|nr:hypothetical protein [Hyphomicrobium sp.]
MHDNWHRHYDPSLGRYTQPDPLGFVDGPSVYAYASSPLIKVDARGLQSNSVPTISGGPICTATGGDLKLLQDRNNIPPPGNCSYGEHKELEDAK